MSARPEPLARSLPPPLAPAPTPAAVPRADARARLSLWIRFGINLLLCVAIAVFLSMTRSVNGTFGQILVFSFAIGLLAQGVIEGGRVLLWGATPPLWGILSLWVLAAPTAMFGGSAIGRWVTGSDWHPGRLQGGTWVTWTVTVLGGLLFVVVFWHREQAASIRARLAEEQAAAAQAERRAAEAHLRVLQAQIEPHFLFNTLANLKALISLDPPAAERMLEQFDRYLRGTLSASRAPWSTVDQEAAHMRDYLALMSIRMGARLRWQVEVSEPAGRCRMAPMLIQPLVENAIRHGLEPRVEGGSLELLAQCGRDAQGQARLQIRIRDTGMGLPADQPAGLAAAPSSTGGGVGLSNVRDRLMSLYGTQARLEWRPLQPHGTEVLIECPAEPA